MNKNISKLPELTEEYKQQQHQAVLDAEIIYEFELLKEPKIDIVNIIFLLAVSLFTFWFVYLDIEFFWIVVLLNMIIWGTYIPSGNPKVEQKVMLTKKGIVLSELELIPEGFYVALRSTGYIVAVFCIITVFFLGPMMLVGAGAGALMSFQMAGAKKKPRVWISPFRESADYIYQIYTNDNLKNKSFAYMYKLRDEEGDIPMEQRNFYSIRYSATEEEHEKISVEIKKIINIAKVYDRTDL
ncbi:hypothetical protein BS333_20575 [Vibrio azureus]|uniref:Uncharacterized protein n=1 Tax=Vibrio azureus NBRC 104587 TaxID=1219077 RepID=U3AT44_9VIBR|nr:hypothetical protein [Vibrio azureus]AUI88683.1 hypothetical protein BS333_20575 [Vibrio azureus]GAD76935.1 hypothetical protein VAZ01S_056_00170 [Vibrio azureus NBRC 104587]